MSEHVEEEARVGLFDTAPVVTFNGNPVSEPLDRDEEVQLRVSWPDVENGYLTGPVNSAGVDVERGDFCDRVDLHVSVGDPRGAFNMRVEVDRETGELRLSLPHPEDSLPHMGLVPLASPGYYRVTSYEAGRRAVEAARTEQGDQAEQAAAWREVVELAKDVNLSAPDLAAAVYQLRDRLDV